MCLRFFFVLFDYMIISSEFRFLKSAYHIKSMKQAIKKLLSWFLHKIFFFLMLRERLCPKKIKDIALYFDY